MGDCTTTTTTSNAILKLISNSHTRDYFQIHKLFGVNDNSMVAGGGCGKKKNLKKIQKEKERNLTENSVHTFFRK